MNITLKEVAMQELIEETDGRVVQICMVQVVEQLLLQDLCMQKGIWTGKVHAYRIMALRIVWALTRFKVVYYKYSTHNNDT